MTVCLKILQPSSKFAKPWTHTQRTRTPLGAEAPLWIHQQIGPIPDAARWLIPYDLHLDVPSARAELHHEDGRARHFGPEAEARRSSQQGGNRLGMVWGNMLGGWCEIGD